MIPHQYAEKLTYFFIAFALFLFLYALSVAHTGSIIIVLLYCSIALSLLASNIPKVVDIPLHMAYPVRCIELFSFALAVVCFIALCIRQFYL